MRNGVFTATGVWLLMAVAGCSQPDASTRDPGRTGPIKIVTTCGMVTDIVRVVAGDKAEVVGLMGETVDPHTYKPTSNDVKQLLDADVVFYSGLMLEGRMGDTFAQVGRKQKPVYAVTEQIDREFLLEPPEFEGQWDPHVWMDVKAWKQCAVFVAKALSEYDAANAEHYAQNLAAYEKQLDELDAYVKRVIGSIPEEQRILVTAHDAFGYFARAYGIQVKAVQGISTESEAAISDIVDLVDFIVEKKLKAIFVESSVSSESIQAVVEAADDKGWKVTIGGKLFSDAMGATGTYEGTYIGMLDHNATTIARALGGKAPEKGMLGKLGD